MEAAVNQSKTLSPEDKAMLVLMGSTLSKTDAQLAKDFDCSEEEVRAVLKGGSAESANRPKNTPNQPMRGANQ